MYHADDTTVYTIGSNVDQVISSLNGLMSQIGEWSSLNKLPFTLQNRSHDIEKTPICWPHPAPTFWLWLCEFSGNHNLLGSHHWWQTFLTCTRWLSKIFILQKMDALRRISYLPELVLDEIYFKTIIPSVTYTISMWRNCSQSLLHSLDHIHARACRIINHLPSKLDDSICLSKCNWLTFDYLYKKRILLKMYQVWTESAPRPIQ